MQLAVIALVLLLHPLGTPGTPMAAPTVSVNPALPGNFTTQRKSYNLTELKLNEFPASIEVLAEVTYPIGARGIRPLVLFLHGRQESCFSRTFDTSLFRWPCPRQYSPLPSYQGYRYMTDILASQGYIVVSISANGINGQDDFEDKTGISARSILIRHHLALWAQWNSTNGDPFGGLFQGKVNLKKVVLVGHDRGGEAIHRAAIDAALSDPYKIVGLMAYGPTAYGRQVTPDVHSATILPLCDGKVLDNIGQVYIDASRDIAYSQALRSAVMVPGANSNYFNTEWTPGLAKAKLSDEWQYPDQLVCGFDGDNPRLSPQEQRAVGLVYTLALVRLATFLDPAMLPLLDGSFVRPESIGRAEVTTSAVGGAKNRLLYRPGNDKIPLLQNKMTGNECFGNMNTLSSLPSCRDGYFGIEYDYVVSPHFTSSIGPDHPMMSVSGPGPVVLELEWRNKKGAVAKFPIRNVLSNFTDLDWLDVRIANDPYEIPATFTLMVTDRNGKNATLLSNLTTIENWPHPKYLNNRELLRIQARTLRGNLASVRNKVDISSIVTVHLVAVSDSGKVFVLDVAASQAQVRRPKNLNLSVISIESATILEGDGPQTYSLNVTSNQPLTSPGSIWVSFYDRDPIRALSGFQVDLAPGLETVVASVPVFNGSLYSSQTKKFVANIAAKKGVVTGNFRGTVTLEDPLFP